MKRSRKSPKRGSLATIETLCEHLATAADAYEDLLFRYGKRSRGKRKDLEKWRNAIRDAGVMGEII